MDSSVFLAGCDGYEQDKVDAAVLRALAHFGGAGAMAGKGKKVVIKPNLLMPRNPKAATTTHPAVVVALVKAFRETGAEVSIVESSGGPYNKAVLALLYRTCGMEEAARVSGARLNDDCSFKRIPAPEGCLVRELPILTPILEADLVVSAAKLKTHGMAYYTGAVKNMYGAVPGLIKVDFHRQIPDHSRFGTMLVDLCETIKPGFSLIDGVIGMEGQGPSGGTPKRANVLIAARNPHAADVAGCAVMGLRQSAVHTLNEAIRRGLAPEGAEGIDWAGDDWRDYRTKFRPAVRGVPAAAFNRWPPFMRPLLKSIFVPYPAVQKNVCVGCGDCARICSGKTISMKEGKAEIERSGCIKCYCCHEVCPAKAIRY